MTPNLIHRTLLTAGPMTTVEICIDWPWSHRGECLDHDQARAILTEMQARGEVVLDADGRWQAVVKVAKKQAEMF